MLIFLGRNALNEKRTFAANIAMNILDIHTVRNYPGGDGQKFTAIFWGPGYEVVGERGTETRYQMICLDDPDIRHAINQVMTATGKPLAEINEQVAHQILHVLHGVNFLVEISEKIVGNGLIKAVHLHRSDEAPECLVYLETDGEIRTGPLL